MTDDLNPGPYRGPASLPLDGAEQPFGDTSAPSRGRALDDDRRTSAGH
jgi:hypothetical protein